MHKPADGVRFWEGEAPAEPGGRSSRRAGWARLPPSRVGEAPAEPGGRGSRRAGWARLPPSRVGEAPAEPMGKAARREPRPPRIGQKHRVRLSVLCFYHDSAMKLGFDCNSFLIRAESD